MVNTVTAEEREGFIKEARKLLLGGNTVNEVARILAERHDISRNRARSYAATASRRRRAEEIRELRERQA